jgi:hypothetical protein
VLLKKHLSFILSKESTVPISHQEVISEGLNFIYTLSKDIKTATAYTFEIRLFGDHVGVTPHQLQVTLPHSYL